MATATIYTECERCGAGFYQPYDPGRRRRFCSGACKQAAYRARKRAETAGQHDADEERAHQHQQWWQEREHQQWRQERERERQRQRAEEERARRARERFWDWTNQQRRASQPPPASGNGHRTDSAEQARIRRIIDGLLRKAASTSFPHEAAACREKAEYLRRKHHLP